MTVFLSPIATEQLTQIISYLESHWSDNVKENFIAKLQRAIQTISLAPKGFPVSLKFPGLHKCVVTSQTIAYYRIDATKNEVEIIAFFDSRQNPAL